MRVGATDEAVQLQPGRLSGGTSHSKRDAEHRVGADLGLVGRTVRVQQGLVDHPLILSRDTDDGRREHVQDGLHGLGHALAEVAIATVT